MSDAIFTGVSSDTRQLRPGEIFVALRGERFDGHDYLEEAARRGAVAAIVSDRRKLPPSLALPLIEVDDTLAALRRFAATYRQRMPLHTIAVTGSNGKTSTKDMIATLLAERFNTVKTEGNLNNHIGVPLSLLRIQLAHEAGVFEMGMNHPGELAPLAAMAAAEVGVITNVGPAHLEGMGDEEAVAREKAAIIENLPAHGAAVLNADNRWTPFLRERTRACVVTAGLASNADVRAENIRRWEGGVAFDLVLPAAVPPAWPRVGPAAHSLAGAEGARVPVKMAAIGDHWISNALLAAAAARVFGLTSDDIAAGFEKIALPAMRMQAMTVHGVRWINDAYNANPDSMRAALRALAAWPCAGRRVAVLGDMLELGDQSEPLHRQIGVEAAAADLALLVTVGPQSRFIAAAARARGMEAGEVIECEDMAGAVATLRDRLKAGDCVLLKASRGMKLESLIEALVR